MSTVLSTVVDYVGHSESGAPKRPSWNVLHSNAPTSSGSSLSVQPVQTDAVAAVPEEFEMQSGLSSPAEDPELHLPSRGSLFMVIATNALLQFSFFVTVSSAALYAEYLGGSALFAGLTIGIPTVFSGLALVPLAKYDGGRYSLSLKVAYISIILGNILHAVAYKARFLYLILVGRVISGLGFTGFMYSKHYCSDPCIIGFVQILTFL
ncbi:hypothetical protein DFH08DRAFT_51513 [Mycena albidolilacea]|uniref:Major facilitator superfamily (MFS) profile domain-containing protein n=1 Tax=Mycena albidolilacea TaxID=1033008 RepID=A0AAD6Z253_9AGAR|nr:hypothetical protein DFH08DRAFT_51513 [Mycena albidolilacea]